MYVRKIIILIEDKSRDVESTYGARNIQTIYILI